MPFAALDLLAAIVTDVTAQLGAFDRLAVNAGSAGCLLAAFLRANLTSQGIDEFLPGAVLLPGNKIIPGGAFGDQIVGQIVPLAAGSSLIKKRVDNLAQIHRPTAARWLAGGEAILDQVPLFVRQIGSVRL